MSARPTCAAKGCERPARSLGLCAKHYQRQWLASNPDKRQLAAARQRRWVRANPERRQESLSRSWRRQQARRRALRIALATPCPSGHEPSEKRLNKRRQPYCHQCRVEAGRKVGAGGFRHERPRQRPPMQGACIICGDPCRFVGGYCMKRGCQREADRARDAATAYHGRSKRPVPQPDTSLPPLGILVSDHDGERIQCHECGKFYRRLHRHIQAHGTTPEDYRARFELPRTLSLASPAEQEALRLRAERNNLGERGKSYLAALPPSTGRRKGTAARLGERILRSRQ